MDTQPNAGATGRWTLEENAKLTRAVANTSNKKHGKEYRTDWVTIAALFPGRTKIHCYNRWHNCLDPNIDRATGRQGKWTADEEELPEIPGLPVRLPVRPDHPHHIPAYTPEQDKEESFVFFPVFLSVSVTVFLLIFLPVILPVLPLDHPTHSTRSTHHTRQRVLPASVPATWQGSRATTAVLPAAARIQQWRLSRTVQCPSARTSIHATLQNIPS
jgi:Pyruvate/2-oxoacid:ferredoxin oxidoreductase delta subunit